MPKKNRHTLLVLFYYVVIKCLRLSAVSTLSDAIGLSPRNVVRLFKSASDIVRSSLAIHSSANELLTTFTPVKSSTTRSFCSIVWSSCSRTRFPRGRVPRFSPYSLKLNVTIIPLIQNVTWWRKERTTPDLSIVKRLGGSGGAKVQLISLLNKING